MSESADLIAMQVGTMAVITFAIVFYGQWTAGIEAETRKRTEIIQRIADDSLPAEARALLGDLDDYLGSAVPTRRSNQALIFFATQARQAVLTALVLWEWLLWFALLDRSGSWGQWARSPEEISVSPSASTLLLVVTLGMVFAGIIYISEREKAVRRLAKKAQVVSVRIFGENHPFKVVQSVSTPPSCPRMVGSVIGPVCAGFAAGWLMGLGFVATTGILLLLLSVVVPIVILHCPRDLSDVAEETEPPVPDSDSDSTSPGQSSPE